MTNQFLLIGLGLAVVKIIIEYPFYAKKKSESLFHGIGLSIICLIIGAILFLFGWREALITSIVYWNVFELLGNLMHGQRLFYVGENAKTDKLIRGIGIFNKYFYSYFDFKAFIHLTTLTILIFIL